MWIWDGIVEFLFYNKFFFVRRWMVNELIVVIFFRLFYKIVIFVFLRREEMMWDDAQSQFSFCHHFRCIRFLCDRFCHRGSKISPDLDSFWKCGHFCCNCSTKCCCCDRCLTIGRGNYELYDRFCCNCNSLVHQLVGGNHVKCDRFRCNDSNVRSPRCTYEHNVRIGCICSIFRGCPRHAGHHHHHVLHVDDRHRLHHRRRCCTPWQSDQDGYICSTCLMTFFLLDFLRKFNQFSFFSPQNYKFYICSKKIVVFTAASLQLKWCFRKEKILSFSFYLTWHKASFSFSLTHASPLLSHSTTVSLSPSSSQALQMIFFCIFFSTFQVFYSIVRKKKVSKKKKMLIRTWNEKENGRFFGVISKFFNETSINFYTQTLKHHIFVEIYNFFNLLLEIFNLKKTVQYLQHAPQRKRKNHYVYNCYVWKGQLYWMLPNGCGLLSATLLLNCWGVGRDISNLYILFFLITE